MFRQLLFWFLANAILPIAIPVLCLCTASWLYDGSFPFWEDFMSLLEKGFYIFSALALIFSLFEENEKFKMCANTYEGMIIAGAILVTCVMFYLIETKDEQYIKNHITQFLIIWLASALYAGYVKYKLLKFNKTTKS